MEQAKTEILSKCLDKSACTLYVHTVECTGKLLSISI